jgi:DNA-binding CsgD family transcriptional regulator
VRENGKVIEQSHNRLRAADCVLSVHGTMSATQILRPLPVLDAGKQDWTREAMECFGGAILELLECNRCVVAAVPENGNSIARQVRIGHSIPDQISAALMAQIARKLTSEGAVLSSTNSDDVLVRNVIGYENRKSAHSLMGRTRCGDGHDVVFVAGWQASPVPPADMAWLSRAIPAIWTMATRLTHSRAEWSDLEAFLEELVFPAFVVDERRHLHAVNRSGRKLLLKGEPLKMDGGSLAGFNQRVTNGLKQALRNALASGSDQRWANTTVVLSAGHRQFSFAWIGAVPTRRDARQALVIVPQVDGVAGARRIATAFGLNSVEEKIIARILHDQCLRRIAADLRLSEATVRTYTKRIMFKLGINRQSELFLLYILTLSPFGAGRPERSVSCLSPYAHANGRAYCSVDH